MFHFRGTWKIIFLVLFFATTLTFAQYDDDYGYSGSGDNDYDYSGSGEYFSFLSYVPVF